MVPYTEEIKEKMEQNLEEFQVNMIVQGFKTQLNQKIQQDLLTARCSGRGGQWFQ